jgi:hypothetical protein
MLVIEGERSSEALEPANFPHQLRHLIRAIEHLTESRKVSRMPVKAKLMKTRRKCKLSMELCCEFTGIVMKTRLPVPCFLERYFSAEVTFCQHQTRL